MIEQSSSDGGERDDEQEDEEFVDAAPGNNEPVRIGLDGGAVGQRLDRTLAAALDPELGLSRSRLRVLIEGGALSDESGATLRDPSAKVKAAATFLLRPPPPKAAAPQPEAIPLSILYEDDALLVVDKPAGMATHPAPGSWTGTLVNAVLAHCGDSLSGVGGELRPGVVHRIDKLTSGLLVLAKSDRAHQGLAAQFAAHSIERAYRALVWGAPSRADPRLMGLRGVSFAPLPEPLSGGDAEPGAVCGRIETELARSRSDRKKMATVFSGGKRAVTWFRTVQRYDVEGASGAASQIECRLETGRTHQIRVHMAYAGHGLLGDPLYGRASASRLSRLPEQAQTAMAGLQRQALHATALGFIHPISGEAMSFSAPPPEDFLKVHEALAAL